LTINEDGIIDRDREWKDLGLRIGGPHMLLLPDRRLVAAVRLYDGGPRTSLCWIDPQAGKLTEALELPSGGQSMNPTIRHFEIGTRRG